MVSFENYNNPYYYVLITQAGKNKQYQATFCSEITLYIRFEEIKIDSNRTLLFFRQYKSHLDALAFKSLLHSLSANSIEAIIKRHNPKMVDLTYEIYNHHFQQ